MRRQRPTWLITRWSKRRQQAMWQAAEEAAQAHQDAEYLAAKARMLAVATEPTVMLPVVPASLTAPLLTRAQLIRSSVPGVSGIGPH